MGKVYSNDTYKYFIENSIWVVPPSTLLAYSYSSGTVTPIVDQTVWVISSYNDGFFLGKSYAALGGTATLSQMNLLGTITNEGAVYITFYPLSGSTTSSDLVNGIGSFTKQQGIYCFTMQMNSGSSTNGLSHWSYMVSVTPGTPYYESLPGVGLSVPQFLELF
jgi:hypothetical protein